MTYGFQRTATGRVVLRVDDVERGLLMSVARQVMDLVQPAEASPDQDPLAAQLGWVDGDVGISDDPAVPDSYPTHTTIPMMRGIFVDSPRTICVSRRCSMQ